MKRALLSISSILLASALAYAAYFHIATGAHKPAPPRPEFTSLTWIDQDFKLSAQDLQAVQASHFNYLPRSQKASAQLLSARKNLTAWPEENFPTANKLREAHQEVLRLERECFEMAVGHIFEIGALMGPVEGPRYQKIMLKKLMTLEGREHLPMGNLLETSS